MVVYKAPQRMLRVAGGIQTRMGPYRTSSTELKFLDQTANKTLNETGILLFGGSGPRFHPSQGTGDSERIGRCHTMRRISGRIVVSNENRTQSAGSNVSANEVRIVVVIDTQCNGTSPTDAIALEVLNGYDVKAFRNLDNVYRFKVLWDKTFTLSNTGGGYDGTNAVSYGRNQFAKFSIPLNVKVHSSGSGNTTSNIADNNLIMFAVTNTADEATVKWSARLRFSDA